MTPSPGLYVHVPFCSEICPYCDFAVRRDEASRHGRFVAGLVRELELRGVSTPFDTVYFGGGTPSVLAPEHLASVLDAAPRTDDARVFLEINPENVTASMAERWKALGVTTASLGVQSFDDDALGFLGRRHSRADAVRAVDALHTAGLRTVSIDLMFGASGQTVEAWHRELETAVRLEPDHISCYQLTIHDDTAFGRRERGGETLTVSDDAQADLFRATHDTLEDAGYIGYEVSNFARGDEHRSRHNAKYWDHTPYAGIGPSAHSFEPPRRFWNERSLGRWLARGEAGEIPTAGGETLDDEALLLETVMLRMRTRDGLDLRRVRDRFGIDLVAANRALVERLSSRGLIEMTSEVLRPTTDGLAIADSLAASFHLESETCRTPRQ